MFEAQRCGGRSMLGGATSKSICRKTICFRERTKFEEVGILRLEEVSLQAVPIVFSFKCPFSWPRDSFQLM